MDFSLQNLHMKQMRWLAFGLLFWLSCRPVENFCWSMLASLKQPSTKPPQAARIPPLPLLLLSYWMAALAEEEKRQSK